MCLTVDYNKMGLSYSCLGLVRSDALIAKRPLIVRKRMSIDRFTGDAYTPYQRFPMKYGVRYTAKKAFDIHGDYDGTKIDGGGFHAVLSSANKENCRWLRHADATEKLVYGIIPKGTHFFLGVDNDIVSKSIILYANYRDLVDAHGTPIKKSNALPVINYTQRAPK